MSGASPPNGRPDARRSLERDVSRYARREPSGATFWRSLSLLGTVGWSISIPAVLGAWLGHRLDVRFETGVHFTLILLTLGVIIGSVVVWRVLRSHQE